MGLRPIHNNILIKLPQEPKENITKGGIHLPDNSGQGLPMKGEVVAAGAGKLTDTGQLIPMRFNVGDIVVFKKYSGVELILNDNRHLIMTEDNILGTLDDAKDIDNQ